MPVRNQRTLAAIVACGISLAAAPDSPAVDIVYLANPQADAVHAAGAGSALRQMPAPLTGNPRWPVERRIAKVAVTRDRLATRSATQMAALLSARMRAPNVGGRVAVDELNPNAWTPAQARNLVRAMAMLGPEARRVVFYASASLVEQVGRTDPRRPLAPVHAHMLNAMARAGQSYLQTYRRGWVPIDAATLALQLPRWSARWRAAGGGRLGLLIGPSLGTTQRHLWGRLRATPAGRAFLADGVAIAGGRAMTREDALDWMAEYRAFRAAPDAPGALGESRPGLLGPPRIEVAVRARPGAPYVLRANRPGRAVVRLVPLNGPRVGHPRVIRALRFSAAGRRAGRLPVDVRPGRYRLLVTFSGEGAGERTRRDLTVLPARRA